MRVESNSDQEDGLSWGWCGVLALAAAALRLPAFSTDFWLDEIWSYDLARKARSIMDVLVSPALKIDNNHQLNTAILYWLGDQRHWTLYRIPVVLAGLLTVVTVARIAGRRARLEGVFAALAVAVSFMMVVYTTEARGYGFLLLFVMLAFGALRRYLDSPSLRPAVLFWIWIVLGLAAHPAIAHFYIGALLWSGYRLRGKVGELVQLHAVPIVWCLAWTAIVLLGSRVGGGPPWAWRTVADQSLAWTFGFPISVAPAWLTVGAAAALVALDVLALWRQGRDEGLFYVGCIFGPPILVAALSPPWLFPRYFLVSLLFLLISAARSLSRVWNRGVAGHVVALGVLLLFIGGNIRHIIPFAKYGRGMASSAVRELASSITSGPVTVTSTSTDLWTSMPIAFYEHALELGDRLRYITQADLAQEPGILIDWLIVQGQNDKSAPPETLDLASHGRFHLKRDFPAYGPSGMRWVLYEVTPATPR